MQDALGALWGLLSQSGRRGMGASQKFLVSSLRRTDFRKPKVQPLACAFFNERDCRLVAASASCLRVQRIELELELELDIAHSKQAQKKEHRGQ